jgi:hypothetical protein
VAYDAHVNARSLALFGSVVRGAWGLGALAAPEPMRKAQLTGGLGLDLPDARLYVRGFGGHQLLIAGFTIAALRSDELLRPALVLSALLDGFDIASAVAEIPARGGPDRTTVAGIVFSGGGALTFLAALRALDR